MTTYALSVRQPWAWAIIHAGKDIENRDWRAPNPGLTFTGRVMIHASKGLTQAEYARARDFMASLGVNCPAPHELLRGGIIGEVTIDGKTRVSASPWFFGPVGLVLSAPKPLDFIRCDGKLGFFKPEAMPPHTPEPAARWMLKSASEPATPCQGALL